MAQPAIGRVQYTLSNGWIVSAPLDAEGGLFDPADPERALESPDIGTRVAVRLPPAVIVARDHQFEGRKS